VGGWLLGVILLAPAISQPVIGIGLVGGVVAIWLASKSIAYPLALAGIPTLVTAIVGSDPLPKGGATILTAGWVGLAVVLLLFRRREGTAIQGLLSLPFAMALLILALMVLRLNGSPAAAYGMSKTELYVADNIAFLIGAVFVASNRSTLRLFLIVTMAVVLTGSLLLIFQLVTGAAQQQYTGTGRFTVSAQEGSINLGRQSSNGALIAIGLILITRETWLRLTCLVAIPMMLLSLLAAGSRGPTVAFVIGLLVLVTLSAATGRARRQLLLVGAGMIGAAIVIPLLVPSSSIGRSLSTILGSSSGLSSNGRSALWAIAFAAFKSHLWFGIGTGGFSSLSIEPYPHNVFLETGAELGIFGVLAVATMIGSMFSRLRTLWQSTDGTERLEITLLLGLFVSAFVNALFSGQISDNSDLWLWGGIGLGIYSRHRLGARTAWLGLVRSPRLGYRGIA
jgi:O-antigen ligase